MSLFGKSAPDKTVLILDIENGSVGSALALLRPGQVPRLVGESRVQVPLMDARSAQGLLRGVEHAANESLLRASELAARLRYSQTPLGPVEKVAVFLAAPWGVPNLAAGRPELSTALLGTVVPRIEALFEAPVAVHAHASAAVHGLRALQPDLAHALVVSVNGEVTELLLMQGGHVTGHATVPVGLGHALRTLKAHAGHSEHEARSALHLEHMSEASDAAAEHFAGEFMHTARDLSANGGSNEVFVLAPAAAGDWFACALSRPSLASLYPQGGRVRAIRGGSLGAFVSSASMPDAHLALNTLYAAQAHA